MCSPHHPPTPLAPTPSGGYPNPKKGVLDADAPDAEEAGAEEAHVGKKAKKFKKGKKLKKGKTAKGKKI